MEFLHGKKTHLVAALMVMVGVINMLTGDASGMQMVMDNAMILLSGFGLSALRAGVSKV